MHALIGIQARSTSVRLPNKALVPFDGKPALERVLDACEKAKDYLAKDCKTDVVILCPKGDPIKDAFKNHIVIDGSEKNVLSRYVAAQELINPDYMVRVTGDCYLHSPKVIATAIRTAVKRDADYTSNVEPRVRTALDGHDVEVLSPRMLDWVKRHALTDYDREHVTTIIREKYPEWCKIVHLVSDLDLSHLKLSVDTAEDFNYVANVYRSTREKKQKLDQMCGMHNHSYFVY